ncbi:hypothetical protein BJX70DRAFT_399132 [Aspergillus crustosus]
MRLSSPGGDYCPTYSRLGQALLSPQFKLTQAKVTAHLERNCRFGVQFARPTRVSGHSLIWANYALFIVEWVGDFFTGLGHAEIFHITTGGRVDGKPIAALEPPADQ